MAQSGPVPDLAPDGRAGSLDRRSDTLRAVTYRPDVIEQARLVRARCAEARMSMAARLARAMAMRDGAVPRQPPPPEPPAAVAAEHSTEANRPAAVLILDAEHGLRMALSLVRGWATLLDTKWDRLPESVRREGIGVVRRRGEDVVAALEALIERARAMVPPDGDAAADGEGDAHSESLRPAEAAKILAVSPKTVVRWATEGRLASTVTRGGHHRFSRDEVERVASEMQERRGR